MRVLVTGGAGFIGHHLVRALVERGDEVAVIDDLSSGHRSRLRSLEDRIEFIEGSVLDADALDTAASEREVIFHQAALASVARSFDDPLRSHQVNVTGTMEVMLAAGRQNVRRVLFAGSSSVYGTPKRLPCLETDFPAPESPYGVSKLAAEHYLHTLGRHLGVETMVLRYFNVFGPGQDPASDYAAVIPLFITAVLGSTQPTINGSGSISRDFTYVDNVVEANLRAASASASGVTCNVACEHRTTLLELLQSICRAAGRDIEPLYGEARAGDIQHSLADTSLARKTIGYEVLVPFDVGIARTVEWFQQDANGPS